HPRRNRTGQIGRGSRGRAWGAAAPRKEVRAGPREVYTCEPTHPAWSSLDWGSLGGGPPRQILRPHRLDSLGLSWRGRGGGCSALQPAPVATPIEPGAEPPPPPHLPAAPAPAQTLRSHMESIYFPDTVEEWMEENVNPHMDRLREFVRDFKEVIRLNARPKTL
ncbi:putative Hexosaminidase D-like protein, partial [Naja naja]